MSEKITTISDLKGYSRGAVVELPPFADGQPFVARLKRPSMLALAKSGKIPNELLSQANELFMGGKGNSRKINQDAMVQMFDIFDVLCAASFVEPTYEEIQESGIELTDDQYAFIFNYSQSGVKALESFRQEQGDTGLDSTKQNV